MLIVRPVDCDQAIWRMTGSRRSYSKAVGRSRPTFQQFLEGLPNNVFRAKGILWIEDSDKRCIFHLVGRRFTLTKAGRAPRVNRLVLIGRNLDQTRLREELAKCLT